MSAPSVAELRAAAELDDRLARVLEGQLDRLDPTGAPYARRAGVELRPRAYPGDELGSARFCADLAASRRAYLESRWHELSARADRRERAAAAAAAGIERLTGPGRRSLDELLEPEREIRRARWEAAGR